MPVLWSPDGSHLWYDFECGRDPVQWTVPRRRRTSKTPKNKPREREDTPLPVFGRDRGVILTRGLIYAIDYDGEIIW